MVNSSIVICLIFLILFLFLFINLTSKCDKREKFNDFDMFGSPEREMQSNLMFNKCSPDCCGYHQWNLKNTNILYDETDVYDNWKNDNISSNITCRNSVSGSGCLCLTPENLNFFNEEQKYNTSTLNSDLL